MDNSPPSPGSLTETMSWDIGANSAIIQWYGFHDAHSTMEKYYVTFNGVMQSMAATSNNDQTVYSMQFSSIGLSYGQRYRVVVVGVNSGGLVSSVVEALEAHAEGQLTVLKEVCHTETLCQKEYVSNALSSASDMCTPYFGVNDGNPRFCTCSFNVNFCVDVPADPMAVSSDVWNNFNLTVYDGFQQNVDIDFQPFVGTLGATWEVSNA